MAQLILDFRDDRNRPAIRTIAEALEKLRKRGHNVEKGTCEILAPYRDGQPTHVAGLAFTTADGEKHVLALPSLRGCWVTTTLGERHYLTLDKLDGAHVDGEANVHLADDSWVRGVTFDVLRIPLDWSDLEHAIVCLTIRYCEADFCIKEIWSGIRGVDYSTLHGVRVDNVKELCRFINARIGQLPRAPGEPPFAAVTPAKVHRTLDMAGIRKVRGRPRAA